MRCPYNGAVVESFLSMLERLKFPRCGSEAVTHSCPQRRFHEKPPGGTADAEVSKTHDEGTNDDDKPLKACFSAKAATEAQQGVIHSLLMRMVLPPSVNSLKALDWQGLTENLQSNVGERVDHWLGYPAGTRATRACTQ